MGLIILGFALFSAVFALLLRKGISIVGTRLGRQVAQRHRSAEEILETGRVPRAWYREFCDGEGKRFLQGPQEREFRIRARKHFLRRVDALLRYFGKAPVFDSEETRRMLTGRLEEARRRWANDRWTDIIQE